MLLVIDGLDPVMCEQTAVKILMADEIANRRRSLIVKRCISVVPAILIVIVALFVGPWIPDSANDMSRVRIISTQTRENLSRTNIKEITSDVFEEGITDIEVCRLLEGMDIASLKLFSDAEIKKYTARYYDSGDIHSIELVWSIPGKGTLSLEMAPEAEIPISRYAIVKPWYKPTLVNGYKVYICQWVMLLDNNDAYVVAPNEYDLFMKRDSIVIHGMSLGALSDELLTLGTMLSMINIDFGVLKK